MSVPPTSSPISISRFAAVAHIRMRGVKEAWFYIHACALHKGSRVAQSEQDGGDFVG